MTISAPEMASSTKLWAGSQLLTKSSWDPGRLTSARRITTRDQLPRGDTWHTWDRALAAHPINREAGTREMIEIHRPPGTVRSPSTWSPELLGPGKGTKRMSNQVFALWSTWELESEQLRPGKCTKPRACFGKFPCRATWSLSSVDRESTGAVSCGKCSVVHTLQALPTHASDIYVECSSLPTAQLNKLA